MYVSMYQDRSYDDVESVDAVLCTAGSHHLEIEWRLSWAVTRLSDVADKPLLWPLTFEWRIQLEVSLVEVNVVLFCSSNVIVVTLVNSF